MLGAPMGWVNTPQIYQARILEEILKPAGIYSTTGAGCLQWMDDSLIYADTFDQYLSVLERLLDAAIAKNLRFNIDKCIFLAETIEWCGRRVTRGKWKFDDRHFEKVLRLPKPKFYHKLAQAVYVANWLAPSIPEFASWRDKFREYTNLRGGTMRELERQNLPVYWTPELTQAWTTFRETIVKTSRTYLHNYEPDEALLVITDASDTHWSLVIMQSSYTFITEPINFKKLEPKPMMFLSGKFTLSQQRWHISQKELNPIVHAFNRLRWLLLSHPGPVYSFTDHRSLKYLLRPELTGRTQHLERLRRWALLFQNVDLVVLHIPADQNYMADLLTRWGSATNDVPTATLNRVQRTEIPVQSTLPWFDSERISPLNPWYRGDWSIPSSSDIAEDQRLLFRSEDIQPFNLRLNKGGKILISFDMGCRITIANHLQMHHPKSRVKEIQAISNYRVVVPNKPDIDIDDLVVALRRKCLHCQRTPRLTRRPYNLTHLANKPGQMLHSDFLYVNKTGYILTLMDNFSGKVLLEYTPSANGETVAQTILTWRAHFSLDEHFILVTDNGSHYANNLLKRLRQSLRFSQQFTVAYAPWTNGIVERINSPILRHLKTLCSEYGYTKEEWPKVLNIVTHLLNNTPSDRRLKKTPNYLFMGHDYNDNLIDENSERLYTSLVNGKVKDPEHKERVKKAVSESRKLLEQTREKMYRFVKDQRNKENKLTVAKKPRLQYQEGDWVLVSKEFTIRGRRKDKPLWVGPYQVIEVVSHDIYRVQDIGEAKSMVLHACFLYFYEPSGYVPTKEVEAVFLQDYGTLEVEKIVIFRSNDNGYELVIKWYGFPDTENTWEPLEHMRQYIPELIKEVVSKDRERRKILSK